MKALVMDAPMLSKSRTRKGTRGSLGMVLSEVTGSVSP
jgi:hypothetical protein